MASIQDQVDRQYQWISYTDENLKKSGDFSRIQSANFQPAGTPIQSFLGRSPSFMNPAPSANARSTAGCRIAPTRTPASGPFDIARRDPPAGVSPEAAVAEIHDMLGSIGDTSPECPQDID
jgi:hypothetical protein